MAGSDARHSLNRRSLLSLLGGHALLVAGCRRSRATRSIQQAIDAALGYVQRTELQGLECTSERTGASTRLHRQGVVFVASFIARAAGDLLTAEQRARLASRVRRLFREDGWGYSVNAPVDSDDTAFAVHTLLDLGEDTDSDAVVDGLAALRRFQAPGNGWFNTFRDSTESRIARRGGAAENAYVHLGVNANVLSLLDRLGQLTPDAALRLLGECRDVASCRSFYYPFEMYTLSLLLPLSAVAQHPHAHALAQEIAGRQDSDGSWANDSVETALALHALRPFADLAAVRVRGTNWLLEEQGPDGSWNTDRPIWRFPAPGDDAWLALDSQNLVTTSLAIGALRTFPLTATKRKEQENG